MPIFEYTDAQGHRVERIRKVADRDAPLACAMCAAPMRRVEISRPHIVPDGVYSYAPNLGNADAFERRRIDMQNGVKIRKKDG